VGIYATMAGVTAADVLRDFAGQGFGAFKPALGELLVEKLAPMAAATANCARIARRSTPSCARARKRRGRWRCRRWTRLTRRWGWYADGCGRGLSHRGTAPVRP
jgi:hypothetical protein